MCNTGELAVVGDGQHGVMDGLCFCKAVTEGGGQQRVFVKVVAGRILPVVCECEFIVLCDCKVFETVNLLGCLTTDGNGIQRLWHWCWRCICADPYNLSLRKLCIQWMTVNKHFTQSHPFSLIN